MLNILLVFYNLIHVKVFMNLNKRTLLTIRWCYLSKGYFKYNLSLVYKLEYKDNSFRCSSNKFKHFYIFYTNYHFTLTKLGCHLII
jgi:hypothetical protein